ncbi:Predicted membrane protein [Ceraceosorus bombacis]|uniref:Predicted membrane protein n=1 Tax=Ceraceosorus bombacis TaxID=401625 RepID=A0A0P1BAB9_9BASI|nr:Predicted membrane protein [Ceraceosorus bombacis]
MWEDVKQMARDWRTYVRWRYLHWYVLLVLLIVGVALLTIYHRQIVDWLTPISKKVKSVSWGWVIVVAILFVISFPPLFGHEIIGVLCGVVYGLWLGFGILSLGTLLGEIGNFYAFKLEARMTEAWEAEGRDDAASPAGSTAKLYGDGAAGVYSRDDLQQPPFDVEDGRRKPSSAAWSRWANKGSNQTGEEAGPLRDRGVSAEGDAGAIGLSVLNHRDQPPQPDQRLGMARSYSQGSSEDVHEQKALTEAVPASYGRAGPPPTSYNQDYVNDRADAPNGFQPNVQGHRLAPGGHHGQERYQHHSGVGSIYSLPAGSEDNRYGNAAGAGSAAARRNPSVKVQLQDRQNAAMTAVADALYADRTVTSPATYRTQPFSENQRVQGHAGTGSQSYPLQQDAARTMSPRPPSYQTEANGERGQPSNDSRYSYRGQAM